MIEIREALRQALDTLSGNRVPSAGLAAEVLLMHTLGCDRTHLHAHPEQNLDQKAAETFFSHVAERASGKPTQYIVGHQEFWGLDFLITPDVLIPRPETELLVEAILKRIDASRYAREEPFRLIDVGTGSGCIALALAHELPRAVIFACDLSPKALRVAAQNAAWLKLSHRITFLESDLLGSFRSPQFPGSFDFIVSNPPYVGWEEFSEVQREVRDFEPRLALGELERPEEMYRRLIGQAHEILKPSGRLLMEIGSTLETKVSNLLRDGWADLEVHRDLQGLPRVIVARKESHQPAARRAPSTV